MNQLLSQSISYLRFPLIIAVVFTHSASRVWSYLEDHELFEFVAFDQFSFFLSEVIARLAVPIFFFIAGLLFFNNVAKFDKQIYVEKIRSRFWSLVVPYLFWNSFALLVFFVAQNAPYVSTLLSGRNALIADYGAIDFVRVYWDSANGSPFLSTLWFLRDLIVVSLLSPIFYFAISRLGIFVVLSLGVVWFIGLLEMIGFSTAPWFFFAFGAFFSIRKVDFVKFVKKCSCFSLVAYPLLAIADSSTMSYDINIIIHKLGLLFGLIFVFRLVMNGLEQNKIKVNHFLMRMSFFLYVAHEPLLTFVVRLLAALIKPESESPIFVIYLAAIIISVLICMLVYHFLCKKLPSFLSFVSGGRG